MAQENNSSSQKPEKDKNLVNSDDQKGGGIKQREYGESDVLKQTRGEYFNTGKSR